MAGQPRDMTELVRSLANAFNAGGPSVIPTIATKHVRELNTDQRVLATAMQAQALAQGLGIGNMAPGRTIPMTAQTDMYFRDLDHDGSFGMLVGYVQQIGMRMR